MKTTFLFGLSYDDFSSFLQLLLMEIIFNNAWLFLIIMIFVNAYIIKYRSKKYIQANPELEDGYDKYVKGLLFYGNIPWVIIGIGNLTGMTSSLFEYFSPRQMNPIVLTFHGSIVFLWILSIWWIYFNGGAEFYERHPGLARKSSLSGNTNLTAKEVKLFFPLMLLGGIIGMVMMWIMDLPVIAF